MKSLIKSHLKMIPAFGDDEPEQDYRWYCLEVYLIGAGFLEAWKDALEKLTRGRSIKYGHLDADDLDAFIFKSRADGVQRLLPNAILTYDESGRETYGGLDIEIRAGKLEVSVNT